MGYDDRNKGLLKNGGTTADISANRATSDGIPFSYLDEIIDPDDPMDYRNLHNLPSINGTVLKGDLSLEDLGIPEIEKGGQKGDVLINNGEGKGEWIPPARIAEQDNTLPITSAAVYTEIGNINALLEKI